MDLARGRETHDEDGGAGSYRACDWNWDGGKGQMFALYSFVYDKIWY